MATFPLVLHQTYFDQGFFNLVREFDRFIRSDEGPVMLLLGDDRRKLPARVDRRANRNGTGRVLCGSLLRDWFQEEFRAGDTVYAVFEAPNQIWLRHPPKT